MAIQERWIDSINKAATGSRKFRNLMTPVGFVIFLSVMILIIVLSLLVDKLFNFPRLLQNPWDYIVGVPIIIFGAFLTLWSVFHFARMRGTPVPFNPPPKLVQSGPYAYARNPMLTGIFALLFGLGFLIGSISLSLIITPLFIFLNYFELKNIEEPELEKRLGPEYIDYKKRVPMFWPKLKR